MKGNPLLRIAVILLLLIVVFWPVFKVTQKSKTLPQAPVLPIPDSKQGSTNGINSSLPVTLLLHAAPSPIHCSVSQDGVELLTESNCISQGEYRAATGIRKGDDLLVTAEWNDEEPHALRVEVLVHGYQSHLEKSFWGQRQIEDTLPVPDSCLP